MLRILASTQFLVLINSSRQFWERLVIYQFNQCLWKHSIIERPDYQNKCLINLHTWIFDQTEAALMFDAVNVAKRALHVVGQTKPVSTAELSCNSGQQPWDLGLSYFNALKSVSEKLVKTRKWGIILQLVGFVWPLRRTSQWTRLHKIAF